MRDDNLLKKANIRVQTIPLFTLPNLILILYYLSIYTHTFEKTQKITPHRGQIHYEVSHQQNTYRFMVP